MRDVLDEVQVDRIRALNRRTGRDVLGEVVALFVTSTEAQLAALERAVEDCDAEGVVAAAHAIRGSSANVGALRLATLAAAVEDAARRGGLDRQAPARLTAALDEARSAFTQVGATAEP